MVDILMGNLFAASFGRNTESGAAALRIALQRSLEAFPEGKA